MCSAVQTLDKWAIKEQFPKANPSEFKSTIQNVQLNNFKPEDSIHKTCGKNLGVNGEVNDLINLSEASKTITWTSRVMIFRKIIHKVKNTDINNKKRMGWRESKRKIVGEGVTPWVGLREKEVMKSFSGVYRLKSEWNETTDPLPHRSKGQRNRSASVISTRTPPFFHSCAAASPRRFTQPRGKICPTKTLGDTTNFQDPSDWLSLNTHAHIYIHWIFRPQIRCHTEDPQLLSVNIYKHVSSLVPYFGSDDGSSVFVSRLFESCVGPRVAS